MIKYAFKPKIIWDFDGSSICHLLWGGDDEELFSVIPRSALIHRGFPPWSEYPAVNGLRPVEYEVLCSDETRIDLHSLSELMHCLYSGFGDRDFVPCSPFECVRFGYRHATIVMTSGKLLAQGARILGQTLDYNPDIWSYYFAGARQALVMHKGAYVGFNYPWPFRHKKRKPTIAFFYKNAYICHGYGNVDNKTKSKRRIGNDEFAKALPLP